MYFQYDYGLFHESVTHLARLWLNYVHKCICEVDFDQKSSYLWVLGLTTWTFAKYCFWSFRELYKLLLFDIVSFHFCIFVFVWSEKRPKNIVWSVLVTKKSTFAQAWSICPEFLSTICFILDEFLINLYNKTNFNRVKLNSV